MKVTSRSHIFNSFLPVRNSGPICPSVLVSVWDSFPLARYQYWMFCRVIMFTRRLDFRLDPDRVKVTARSWVWNHKSLASLHLCLSVVFADGQNVCHFFSALLLRMPLITLWNKVTGKTWTGQAFILICWLNTEALFFFFFFLNIRSTARDRKYFSCVAGCFYGNLASCKSRVPEGIPLLFKRRQNFLLCVLSPT